MKLKHLMTGTALAVVSAGGAFADDHPSEWYMSFGAGANWVGSDTGIGAGAAVTRPAFTNTVWTVPTSVPIATFSCTFNHTAGSGLPCTAGTFFFTPITTFVVNPTATAPLSMTEDQVGFAILGSVGYKFDMPWRVELEASARFSDLKVLGPVLNGKGHLNAYALMANAIYDMAISERLNLNIGAGAGYGFVRVDARGRSPGLDTTHYSAAGSSFLPCSTIYGFVPITPPDSLTSGHITCFMHFSSTTSAVTAGTWRVEGDDEGFAYQGILGLSYSISDRAELYLDYRYFVITDLSFDFTDTGVVGVTGSKDYKAQNAMIGIRYYFGEEEAPPPPAAEVTKTFIVFFDFNKSNLTAEAQATIADAVAAYQSTGSVHVMVVGHTDTVGSASYNQGLSERRAGSVKAEMVRLGVPGDNIATEGRGFSEPMVPTGPGVKEPQNRRAVIDIQ